MIVQSSLPTSAADLTWHWLWSFVAMKYWRFLWSMMVTTLCFAPSKEWHQVFPQVTMTNISLHRCPSYSQLYPSCETGMQPDKVSCRGNSREYLRPRSRRYFFKSCLKIWITVSYDSYLCEPFVKMIECLLVFHVSFPETSLQMRLVRGRVTPVYLNELPVEVAESEETAYIFYGVRGLLSRNCLQSLVLDRLNFQG